MTSVYHAGERAVQRMAGAEAAAEQNGKTIRNTIPKGVSAFLPTQSLAIATTAGADGSVWCSMLTGDPGFMTAPDERTVVIASLPAASDPLVGNLRTNREIGLLAIDLERRLRVRINGGGSFADGKLTVRAEQVYGNCPKYITKRAARSRSDSRRTEQAVHRATRLRPDHIEWIRRSDTFFIGSRSAEGGADASHRGGPPGFVRVSDERTLVFPDYFGNSMFNTLGNLHGYPYAGLLFIDFDKGHTLQLSGRCEIVWEDAPIAQFPHAERLVRFVPSDVLFTAADGGLYWEALE